MPSKPLRAILFDLDDTLYSYSPCNLAGQKAVIAWLSRKLGLPQQTIKKTYLANRANIHRQLSGQAASHARLLYLKGVIEDCCGKTLPTLTLQAEQIFWTAYFKKMVLRPGVRQLLNKLSKQSIKLAIVTDLTTSLQLSKIVKLRLDHYFDFIITSEEVGHEKPHPAMLKLAMKKLGVKPAETSFVGDSVDRDQVAAQSARVVFIPLSKDSDVKTIMKRI